MKVPSPTRALAGLLVLTGLGAVALNVVGPRDDSLVQGVVLAALGGTALVLRETRALRLALEAIVVLVLVLAGGEITVRRENGIAARAYANRTMRFVDDPVLRYEMNPGLTCGDGVTNARGMIDVPREVVKAPGTLRIACLGDSVGGDCSLLHDNACAALEGILREARGGRPVEVLNFSVPGYNTMQEARALEVKAAPFEPDAVVLLYVVNDPFPDLAISHFLPGHFKFASLLRGAAQFAAWKLIGPPLDPFGGGLVKLHDEPRAWDGVVVAGFDRIAAVAAQRKIPVAVAVFPLFIPSPPPAYDAIYGKVVDEAERHGFVGVNLSKTAFAREPLAALLKPSRDMIHPNAHAHRLAAETIARALIQRRPELVQ
jgi:hypothetical protein